MSGVPITAPSLPTVTVTGGDLVLLWDTETGIQGRTTVTGLGAILALLAGATFSGNVIFDAGAEFRTGTFRLQAADLGAGTGRTLLIDRNSNATTPAPGSVAMRSASNSYRSIYPDNAGVLRIMAAAGITSGDIATGTVVGDQSSSLATKDLLEELSPIEIVYQRIDEGAAAVRAFLYKAAEAYDDDGNPIEGERPYSGQRFEGVIIDYAPAYGKDRIESQPMGRSLNDINIMGDLLRVVADLAARVAALEAAA